MIWAYHLPDPEVLSVRGEIIYDTTSGHHTLVFSVIDFKPAHTSPHWSQYYSRYLSYKRVCNESRAVYLKVFPISLPTCGPFHVDNPISSVYTGTEGIVHLSRNDIFHILNMEEMCYNPYLDDLSESRSLPDDLTTLYVKAWCFGFLRSQRLTYHALIWNLLKAFPNVKDMVGLMSN